MAEAGATQAAGAAAASGRESPSGRVSPARVITAAITAMANRITAIPITMGPATKMVDMGGALSVVNPSITPRGGGLPPRGSVKMREGPIKKKVAVPKIL